MGRTLSYIYGEQCELRINQYACAWEHDETENYNVDNMLSTSANYWQVEQLGKFWGGFDRNPRKRNKCVIVSSISLK
jgi:hypothetical protein